MGLTARDAGVLLLVMRSWTRRSTVNNKTTLTITNQELLESLHSTAEAPPRRRATLLPRARRPPEMPLIRLDLFSEEVKFDRSPLDLFSFLFLGVSRYKHRVLGFELC